MRNLLIVLPSILALAACSSAPPRPAAFIEKPNTCTVLVGGTGMVFPDEAMNQRWFKINSVISNDLAEDLQQKGYRIERMIVDIRSNEQMRTALGIELAKKGCNKFIQVSHGLEGIPEGGGVASYFKFTVTVMGLSKGVAAANGGTMTMITGGFHKDYRYPLTTQVMQTLSMSGVARQIADDIDASGQINKAPAG